MYVLLYLGIHLALTGIYQSTRCDVRNGTFFPNDPCTTSWAQLFVKQADSEHKFEVSFNNLPTMIAFLMGFYVNMVVVRWWEQVGDKTLDAIHEVGLRRLFPDKSSS